MCDDRIRCDDHLMDLKGKLATSARALSGKLPTPNPYGAHERCVFKTTLPYFDLAKMLIVPLSHGMLYGIGKDLWRYLFKPQLYRPKPMDDVPKSGTTRGKQKRGQRGRGRRHADGGGTHQSTF